MKILDLFNKKGSNSKFSNDISKEDLKFLILISYKLSIFFENINLNKLSFDNCIEYNIDNKKLRNISSTFIFIFGYQYEYIYKYGKFSDLISSDYELFMFYHSAMIQSIKLNYEKLITELDIHMNIILEGIKLIKMSNNYIREIYEFDIDIIKACKIIKRIVENHTSNNTSENVKFNESSDLKKYDKAVSLSSLFKKNFSFHVGRYEEWQHGECIAAEEISFDIHFKTDNNKIYTNIPFATKFNMKESVSFDFLHSTVLNDRIQYVNVLNNFQDPMMPIVFHIFIRDLKIDYIRFAMSFPDRLIEFYGYQIE